MPHMVIIKMLKLVILFVVSNQLVWYRTWKFVQSEQDLSSFSFSKNTLLKIGFDCFKMKILCQRLIAHGVCMLVGS